MNSKPLQNISELLNNDIVAKKKTQSITIGTQIDQT